MTLRPYPAYRPVERQTFASIPEHWDVVRGRHLVRIRTGSGDTVDAEPDGQFPFYVRSDEPLRSDRWDFETTAVLTAGDGAGVAKVFHLVDGRFMAHQRVYVLDEFRRLTPRFFYYAFSNLFHRMALDGSAKSTVDSVRRAMIADMPFAVPPLAEQRRIVNFLDRETSQVDALIAKQQRLIGSLRERRSAIRDAHFADPTGKRNTTVRRVLKPLDRAAIPGLEVITAYRDGEVTLRSNRRDDGYTISFTETGYQEVRPGDLVFHALDGFAGAVGVSDSHGNASPVYHVCSVVTDDDSRYVAMLLRFLGTSGFLTTQAPNVRERSVDFRNWSTFARVPIALADPEHQARIVGHINEQTAKIDTLIAKTERFIELAKERRTALITAAVTGQIDVREPA